MQTEKFYCFVCEEVFTPDDFYAGRELMDPAVPGSWQTFYYHDRCRSDDYEELTLDEAVHIIENLVKASSNKERLLRHYSLDLKYLEAFLTELEEE